MSDRRGDLGKPSARRWSTETDPAAKRQFLSLIFGGVWLDHDRVVAVQLKPSFLPFFKNERTKTPSKTGVNDGSDGGQTPSRHRIGIRP